MSSPASDPVTAGPAPYPTDHEVAAGPAARRVSGRGVVLENLAVLAAFAAVGVLAGWLWERWATPPTGIVVRGSWELGYRVQGDFLVGDPDALGHAFGVVATYVVVCAAAGLLLGVVVGVVCRRAELVTLGAVAGGSALAAFLCYRVGLALGPGDPTAAAAKAADGTALTGDLGIDRLAPFVALPLAALLALAVTYLLTAGVGAGVDQTRGIELGSPDRSV